jgi:hypothetical protein
VPVVNHDPRHPPCSKPAPKETFASVLQHLWNISWTGPVIVHCRAGSPTFVEFGNRRLKLGS